MGTLGSNVNGKRRIICAGDLTQRITVQLRAIVTPSAAGVDATIKLTEAKTVWAMLLTSNGQEIFDGTNLAKAYTHNFYIRFIPNTVFVRSGRLSAQEFVTYKSRNFQIVDVENFEERDEFLVIKCIERGANSITVNAAKVV